VDLRGWISVRIETARKGRGKRARLVAQIVPGGDELTSTYHGQPLDGKSLLITRYGGGGDHLFLTALVAELKRRYPTARISIGGAKPWREVWRGSGLIEDYLVYPVPQVEVQKRDYYLTFEGTIEGRKEGQEAEPRRENVYDIFFELAGCGDTPDSRKVPVLGTTPAGRDYADRVLKQCRKPVICYQWEASVVNRTYPHSLSLKLLFLLAQLGQVLLLGKRLPRPEFVPRGVLGLNTPRLEQAFGILSKSDLLVGPDSMFLHAAAALGVATVPIFGPISAEARVRTYPRCFPIEGAAECGPCFTHSVNPCKSPMYERKTDTGEVVGIWCKRMVIPPEKIADAARRALNDPQG